MMKRFITAAVAILLIAIMVVPALAAGSPSKDVPHVPTVNDLPNASDKDAPPAVFVDDENKLYVKAEDFNAYFPEDGMPTAKYNLIKKVDPWTKGKDGDALYASDAPFEKFVAVYIDKDLVDAANYKAESGSTEVTFTKNYMETLSVSEHQIVILSNDGYAKGTFNVVTESSGNHQTGDPANTVMWVAISLVSLGAIGVVAFALTKKRKSAEN
ncbi:MAG: hypothetical protein IKN50_01170 [Clostridia bacterium]|nr:hypothetical protein [Clostridia bacterium]